MIKILMLAAVMVLWAETAQGMKYQKKEKRNYTIDVSKITRSTIQEYITELKATLYTQSVIMKRMGTEYSDRVNDIYYRFKLATSDRDRYKIGKEMEAWQLEWDAKIQPHKALFEEARSSLFELQLFLGVDLNMAGSLPK